MKRRIQVQSAAEFRSRSRSLITVIIGLLLFITIVVVDAQIIGSSVVTSVSVVLGNENETTSPPAAPTQQQTKPTPPTFSTSTTTQTTPEVRSSSSSPVAVTLSAKLKAADVTELLSSTVVTVPASSSTTTSTSRPKPPPSSPNSVTAPIVPPSKAPGSVSSVIATLKSIVEIENIKHKQQSTQNNKSKSDLTEEDYDDDEEEVIRPSNNRKPLTTTTTKAPSKKTTTARPGSHHSTTISATNVTATSAEVHEAIHRISGELLTPGKPAKKPIENILTDVLTSINDARNSTTSSKGKVGVKNSKPTIPPKKPSQQHYVNNKKPTSAAAATNTVNKQSAATGTQQGPPAKATVKPTVKVVTGIPQITKPTTPEPQIGTGVTKIAGIPTDGDDDNVTQEKETEEIEFLGGSSAGGGKPGGIALGLGVGKDDIQLPPFVNKVAQQKRPLPTNKPLKENINNNQNVRPQIVYLSPASVHPGYNNGKRKNGTGLGIRPTEFYDDEIFGYDPYQTFLHGVYVPVVDIGGHGEPIRDTIGEYDPSAIGTAAGTSTICIPAEYQLKTQQRPVASSSFNSPSTIRNPNPFLTENGKPVPNLPDYLHRPRPSHLQYQHAVAETVDAETGLVRIKIPAPLPSSISLPASTTAVPTSVPPRKTTKPPPPPPTNPASVVHNLTASHHMQTEAQFDDPLSSYHEQSHGPIEKRPSFPKAPNGNPGLETSVTNLDTEMRTFVDLNNRLALRLLSSVTNPVSKTSTNYGNMVASPFTIISSLGMLFLGARGGTAAQIDGLLHLDDMLTFNPHLLYYNVTQSFLSQPNTAAAIIRLLIADKSKGDVLEFFKTRVQHFYDTRVEEADYKFAGHLAQSIINQMIRAQIQRHSYEMLNSSLPLKGPMTLLTAAFFDGQFGGIRDPSVQDMNFVHLASVGRRLIQVPAVALTGSHKAVYDPELDATAVEVPYSSRDLSLILIMPGRPGEFGIGGVNALKSRLTLETWTSLTRGFYRRPPFKVIFPRWRHLSNLNISYTLQRFGLTDMFTPHLAKFKGINGLNDLYLDQNAMHFAEFGTMEKLSDTLSEGSYANGGGNTGSNNNNNNPGGGLNNGPAIYPAGSNNKKFDLVRILRPHVREHYGNFDEPMSVGDWIFQQSSLAQAAAAAAATQTAFDPVVPRFTSPPIPYTMLNQYQPFLPYATVRNAKQTEKFNLSRLFTRDSKTKRKHSSHNNNKHQQQKESSDDSSSSEEQVLRFERPFIYVLRHAPTGMILMCGQYTDPMTSNSNVD